MAGSSLFGDTTAQSAVGHVVGESLIASVLSNVHDDLDRALLVAHIALDIPMTSLARQMAVDRADIAARIARALAMLKADDDLMAQTEGVRYAGDSASYHSLIFSIHLQDWFCSNCGTFMVQRGVGRPRRTCTTRCRVRLHRAGGVGWKDQFEAGLARRVLRGEPGQVPRRR